MKKIFLILLIIVGLSACNLPVSEDAVATAIKQTDSAESTRIVDDAPPDTATPTSSPTMSMKESLIKGIEIDSFKLFSSGKDTSNVSNRKYSNAFSQGEAKIIYCEFDFSHPGPEKDVAFMMEATYYGPGGEVYGEVSIHPIVKTGWTESNWIIGFGFSEYNPGIWDAGDYRVDVFLEGVEIAGDSFIIIKDTPTPEPTSTNTPMPGAIVDTDSLNIRKGPGTMYAIVTGVDRGDTLEITGQAYSCDWLKVETENGVGGWVSAGLVVFETPCSSIPAEKIPPTPITLPSSTPIPPKPPTPTTKAQSGKTVKIMIVNNTGGNLTINLSGPATYAFTFGPGNHNMYVLPGTYTYTAWGCGSSMTGTENLKKGRDWTFYCK